jgi:hypothetical protein
MQSVAVASLPVPFVRDDLLKMAAMWDRLAEERERDEIADHNEGSIRIRYPLVGFGF